MTRQMPLSFLLLVIVIGQGPIFSSLLKILQIDYSLEVHQVDWKSVNRQVRKLEGPRSFIFPSDLYYQRVQNSVDSRVLVGSGRFSDNHFYTWLRLRGFYQNTCIQVRQSLKVGKTTVLDLRGNRGGLVEVASCVMDLFVPRGTVHWSYRNYRTGERGKKFVSKNKMVSADSLVILVDGHTASVAEALAGALGELKRAQVVGQTTRGKGTVQVGYWDERWPGSVHYQTRYLFTLPSGKSFQFQGWKPQILVNGFDLRGDGERELYRGHPLLARDLSRWNGGIEKKSNWSKSSSCLIDGHGKTIHRVLEEVFKCRKGLQRG